MFFILFNFMRSDIYIYIYKYISVYIYTYIYIYIWCEAFSYSVKHRKIVLPLKKWRWRCLTSKNVMMFLSILNFHWRINIFCSGEHVSSYKLVWCSWNCLGRMQVLLICFDMCVVVFSFVVVFVLMPTCMWLWFKFDK